MDLEPHVARTLRAALASVPTGSAIPDSEPFLDLQLSLERYIPDLLGWGHESLDAFRFCVARKLGPERVELIGLALLISDQAWTPIWLRISLSSQEDAVAAIDCKVGERGEGLGGMVRLPYDASDVAKVLFALPARVTEIDWVYEARFGEMDDLGHPPYDAGGQQP